MLGGRELIYNVCGQDTISIKNLAKLIAQTNNAKLNYKFKEGAVKGTPLILTLDCNRYISEFKKKSFISLNKGLIITSEWFRNLKQ